jgi:hypothetical protein
MQSANLTVHWQRRPNVKSWFAWADKMISAYENDCPHNPWCNAD